MVKTPEEYFADQCFDAPAVTGQQASLSAAERAFVQKYLGGDALAELPVLEPKAALTQGLAAGQTLAGQPGQAEQAQPALSLKNRLRTEPRVQMVSFFVREQIFLLPVAIIHEVLRHMPLTRLPLAPSFVAGVINLRGRVTPLLHLDALLTNERERRYTAQNFIVVCAAGQMQVGLIIDKVHTMYIVEQERLSWNAEAHLGAGAEFLCGMADIDNHLRAIVDPDLVVGKLIED